jgi:CDP-glycerol glycerophosphotransferase (TagB/SpsB family)
VRQIYSEALAVPLERCLAIGIPRADALFRKGEHAGIAQKVRERYGLDPNKKVLLYAPTFRDSPCFEPPFDVEALREVLEKEWQLVVRLHPRIASQWKLPGGFAVDASRDADALGLLVAADFLLTDYSSVVFDFAALGRPMAFFAPDLEEYEGLRGFYYGFEGFVPGPVARTEAELLEMMRGVDGIYPEYQEQITHFARRFYDPFDGKACERLEELLRKEGAVE